MVRRLCRERAGTLGLVLALTLAVVPCRVGAQVAEVEALVQEGVALRTQHRDAEALARFTRAWSLAPSPRVRVQMAWAAQALGRWAEAERWIDEGLQHADDPWIVRNRDAIAASRNAVGQHLGTLEVLCSVAGAQLEVDGVVVGTLPLTAPLRVPVGSAVLRVTAPGHRPTVREGVTVRVGGLTRETLSLVPLDPEPTPPPPRVTPPVTPPVVPVPPPARMGPIVLPPLPPSDPVVRRDPGASPQRVAGWITLGVGLAVGGVGAAILVDRESDVDAYAARLTLGICTGSSAPDTDPQCQSLRRDAERAQPLGLGLLIGGGVAAGVGLVLALTAPSASHGGTALRCTPTLGMTGVGCALRF